MAGHMSPETDSGSTTDERALTAGAGSQPLTWWKVAQLVLLLNCALFFQGCETSRIRVTAGAAVPFVELVYHEQLSFELRQGSPVLLVLNAALMVIGLYVVRHWRRRWSGLLASRKFLAAAALSVAVFNSFLFLPAIWLHVVFSPTIHLYEAVTWCLFAREPMDSSVQDVVLAVVSRAYFAFFIVAAVALFAFCQLIIRRYVFARQRWWQFNLAALMATMTVLGTGIGMLLRLAGD